MRKYQFGRPGGGDQLASVLIASAPGRSQVAGGEQGRYCYNFITEARTGLRLVGILQLLSPAGLFQPTQSVLGNVIGLFSEIVSASQRVDGRGRQGGRERVLEFVLDNN